MYELKPGLHWAKNPYFYSRDSECIHDYHKVLAVLIFYKLHNVFINLMTKGYNLVMGNKNVFECPHFGGLKLD